MKLTAVGDVLIQRRIPSGYDGFNEIKEFVERGDARFFNLETTLNHEGECHAAQFSGGTYLRARPDVLEDIKAFGFNMTSFNNNHAMDFSYDGLLKTFDAVNASGLVQSGVGRNLGEAAAPNYLETTAGRVALIAVNSSFNPVAMAGKQSRRVPGRPGINGIQVEETLIVSDAQMAALKEIAEQTNINAQKEISRKEGYSPELPEGTFTFGNIRCRTGERTRRETTVNKTDLQRVAAAIFEAKLQSDYIIVSVHSHELSGDKKENPAEFLKSFARSCIDEGANAVIGHGPHLLRPIEIYKNRPIFYSLGDFTLQLYNVPFAPEEFYEKYDLTSDATVHELLKKRSNNFTRGLMTDARMLQTVIPYWETENGDLTRLELLPVELIANGNQSLLGLPRPAENTAFMKALADMSRPYGTEIDLRDGIGHCRWQPAAPGTGR